MIIRKPYAFLIKNFKKIHIFMLILSLYVVYKLIDVNSFVSEFMKYGIYDLFSDPVTNHITSWLSLAVFLLIICSAALVALLYHKQKPWKIYLVPFVEYVALFFVLGMIKSFFRNYSVDVETTDLRLSRDLLRLFLLAELPVIGILIMRIFGLDINKFNFNSDKEFLELSEADREEIEIGFSIDKNSFIRMYKRIMRNVYYFYLEHTMICKVVVGIFVLWIGFSIYKFIFVTNRSYSQGDYYNANGYTMKVNKVYFTDKDYAGNVISEKSNFVIVDFSIRNNSVPRTINLSNLHLKNGNTDYTTTEKTYEKEFYDLGSTYTKQKEVKRDETLSFIIIYKVDKKLRKNGFVLFFQENGGTLRKIKLNITDIRNISSPKTYTLEEEMEVNIKTKPDSIRFDDYEVEDSAEYLVRSCVTSGCTVRNRKVTSDGSYKILRIDFGSEVYDSQSMLSFLKEYGKIIIKNSDGEEEELPAKSVINRNYFGKTLYLKVPSDMKKEDLLRMEFTIRDKSSIYKFA